MTHGGIDPQIALIITAIAGLIASTGSIIYARKTRKQMQSPVYEGYRQFVADARDDLNAARVERKDLQEKLIAKTDQLIDCERKLQTCSKELISMTHERDIALQKISDLETHITELETERSGMEKRLRSFEKADKGGS